jgi:hypothetical protein
MYIRLRQSPCKNHLCEKGGGGDQGIMKESQKGRLYNIKPNSKDGEGGTIQNSDQHDFPE